jgi:hypothetical protein
MRFVRRPHDYRVDEDALSAVVASHFQYEDHRSLLDNILLKGMLHDMIFGRISLVIYTFHCCNARFF